MTSHATQGHSYLWSGIKVLAMASGSDTVPVKEIGPLWLEHKQMAKVSDLVPLGMTYFHGQVP